MQPSLSHADIHHHLLGACLVHDHACAARLVCIDLLPAASRAYAVPSGCALAMRWPLVRSVPLVATVARHALKGLRLVDGPRVPHTRRRLPRTLGERAVATSASPPRPDRRRLSSHPPQVATPALKYGSQSHCCATIITTTTTTTTAPSSLELPHACMRGPPSRTPTPHTPGVARAVLPMRRPPSAALRPPQRFALRSGNTLSPPRRRSGRVGSAAQLPTLRRLRLAAVRAIEASALSLAAAAARAPAEYGDQQRRDPFA